MRPDSSDDDDDSCNVYLVKLGNLLLELFLAHVSTVRVQHINNKLLALQQRVAKESTSSDREGLV